MFDWSLGSKCYGETNQGEQVRESLEGILAISKNMFREGPCEKT